MALLDCGIYGDLITVFNLSMLMRERSSLVIGANMTKYAINMNNLYVQSFP